MCLSPISIPNQTKYVSLKYKDRFLMQIPCGHCAECQQTLSNQWYYRSWYEFTELEQVNGYCLFDTLTYSNKNLPHLSDTWQFVDKKNDYPCFDFLHTRRFLQALYKRIERQGFQTSNCRYFLCSEYGTRENATHRPHYHLLLYVNNPAISPLWLSQQIAELWKYGRTDGVPYKGTQYVLSHNTIFANQTKGGKLRTCHYITKYVQKSCKFQKELNRRLNVTMAKLADYVFPNNPEKWLQSEEAHRERLKLSRYVNQFHRQSQHFGETALRDLDLNQLFNDGCLYMPDSKGVKIPIPLPTYYKRKLFQEQIEFNGSRYWQLTELGKEYKEKRSGITRDLLRDRLHCIALQYHIKIRDIEALTDYAFYDRGRIIGALPESTLTERCQDIDLFNYSTSSDKLNFSVRGLSCEWLGDSQQGYNSSVMTKRISLQSFIKNYCIYDDDFEKELTALYNAVQRLNKGKQQAFELRQRLTNLFKPLVFSLQVFFFTEKRNVK